MDPMALVVWLVDLNRGWQQRTRRVRVLVHCAVFLDDPRSYFFVKATNLSRSREVEITHIWFDTEPPAHVLNRDRPLPVRLRLDETFETWIPVAAVPHVKNIERLGRVRLSSGKTVKSRLNKSVPPIGNVGGPGQQ